MITHEKYNTDPKFCSVNIIRINPPRKTSLLTIEINLTAEVLEKMTVYVKLFYLSDNHYRKEFLRTSFDLEKLFGGGVESFIGKSIFGKLAEAADFPLKFPLTRVAIVFLTQGQPSK